MRLFWPLYAVLCGPTSLEILLRSRWDFQSLFHIHTEVSYRVGTSAISVTPTPSASAAKHL